MEKQPRAALLIIGNEILSGRTHDKNIPHIAEKLGGIGVALAEIRVVADVAGDIVAAARALSERYDYLFTTGGIGPTHDDITAEALAEGFAAPLELNPDAYAMLLAQYGSEAEITPPRRKMALIPKGAALIANPVSGAPGFILGNIHVMAGVPKIMAAMLDAVLPGLKGGPPTHSVTITLPYPESRIAQPLADIQAAHPNTEIGSYPRWRPDGGHEVSVVVRGVDEGEVENVANEIRLSAKDLAQQS